METLKVKTAEVVRSRAERAVPLGSAHMGCSDLAFAGKNTPTGQRHVHDGFGTSVERALGSVGSVGRSGALPWTRTGHASRSSSSQVRAKDPTANAGVDESLA